MTLKSTRKSSLRMNCIARGRRSHNASRPLLQNHVLDRVSLGDVATEANVAKGSAYHF